MRRFWMAIVAAATGLALPGVAFAVDPGVYPGQRISDWVLSNVKSLFVPLLAVMALYYLAKRQFTQFLSFAAFAIFAALFIYAGTEVSTVVQAIGRFFISRP